MEDKISIKKYGEKEYIIRDEMGIIIGRFIVLEEDKDNGYISFRIYFHREGEKGSKSAGIALKKMADMCRISGFAKVTIFCEEGLIINPDSGFTLEGIINDRVKQGTVYKPLYIYGLKLYQDIFIDKGVPVINGDRIKLKLLTPEDSEDLLNYLIRNREHLRPFDPIRKEEFFTIEAQREELKNSFNEYLNKKSYNFGIFKEGSLIGKIRISSIVYGVFHNAFIGYSIDKEEQRKGYMKEAVKQITDFCFNKLDIHRIEASTLTDNIPSQKVLLGSGFHKIGLCPKYLFINGEWRDHFTFYKLKEN